MSLEGTQRIMPLGLIYEWGSCEGVSSRRLSLARRPLRNLTAEDDGQLSGRFAAVIDRAVVSRIDPITGDITQGSVGPVAPDPNGNYIFDPGQGGQRLDRPVLVASSNDPTEHDPIYFGQVNTYFHVDRIASYVDSLLKELGSSSIPQVRVVTHAHSAVMKFDGLVDGIARPRGVRPLQGGHYRLPARRYDDVEHFPIVETGEIHLGPGYSMLNYGALADFHGSAYRHNASHNAGTVYHEYGHHLNRHTADFQGNRQRNVLRQTNRKSAVDEGSSDYWTAVMLGQPHIWAWNRRGSASELHPRDLRSRKTLNSAVRSSATDPHEIGTIWAAALWDYRNSIHDSRSADVRIADLTVIQAMLLLGENEDLVSHNREHLVVDSFAQGFDALLEADRLITDGHYSTELTIAFRARGVID